MGWTDERVELLKKLWLDGLSASQIAKQLGGVTRNAVIGKVHRLGLSGRAAPSPLFQPAQTGQSSGNVNSVASRVTVKESIPGCLGRTMRKATPSSYARKITSKTRPEFSRNVRPNSLK